MHVGRCCKDVALEWRIECFPPDTCKKRDWATFGAGRLRTTRYHKNCDNVAGSTRRGVSSPFRGFRGLAVQTTRGRKPSFFVLRSSGLPRPSQGYPLRNFRRPPSWRALPPDSRHDGQVVSVTSQLGQLATSALSPTEAASARGLCPNLRLDPSFFLPKDQGNRRAEKNRRGIADKAIERSGAGRLEPFRTLVGSRTSRSATWWVSMNGDALSSSLLCTSHGINIHA